MNPGSRLGPSDILALIGSGGMGEVYRAHDARLGRDVAIKVLPAAFSDDPDRLRRFEQDALAAAAAGADGERGAPLSKTIEYGRQMALGLAAAHAKGAGDGKELLLLGTDNSLMSLAVKTGPKAQFLRCHWCRATTVVVLMSPETPFHRGAELARKHETMTGSSSKRRHK